MRYLPRVRFAKSLFCLLAFVLVGASASAGLVNSARANRGGSPDPAQPTGTAPAAGTAPSTGAAPAAATGSTVTTAVPPGASAGDGIILESRTGARITGRILNATTTDVTIRRSDGQIFTLPRADLTVASLLWLDDWIKHVGPTLDQPGRRDRSFRPPEALLGRTNAITLADGHIFVGGSFTVRGTSGSQNLLKLQMSGALDPKFSLDSVTGGRINAIAASGGQLFLGGDFNYVRRVNSFKIGAVRTDGGPVTGFQGDPGANNSVNAVVFSSALYVAGEFTAIQRQTYQRVAKLTPLGEVVTSFNDSLRIDGAVRVMVAFQGGVLIAGDFRSVNYGSASVQHTRLSFITVAPVASAARFNDGYPDLNFKGTPGPDGDVLALAVQPDNKILVGGSFSTYHRVRAARVARLQSNGALDTGFSAGAGPDGYVRAIAVQGDGKILIGGSFTQVSGKPRKRLARLHKDGSLDESFDPGLGADADITTIVVQPDRKILIGGAFAKFDDFPAPGIARILP